MSNEREVWVPVSGIPYGFYSVSNLGRVKSHARVSSHPWSPAVNEKILKGWLGKDGYWMVSLCYYGRTMTRSVHSLVAETFIGPRYGLDTRHVDGDRSSTLLSNLLLGTRSENMADAKRHGTFQAPPIYLGEDNHAAKLDASAVLDIRHSSMSGVSLADKYGVTRATISDVRMGKTWKHLLGPWRQGRQRGSAHHAAKLTEDAVLDIRYSRSRVCDLMRKYGISKQTVRIIRNFKAWRHVRLLTDPISIEQAYGREAA